MKGLCKNSYTVIILLFVIGLLALSIFNVYRIISTEILAGKIINGYTQCGNLKLDQVQLPKAGDKVAVIITTKGEFRVRLFEAIAPETVNLFESNVIKGLYDNRKFSRIEKNFLVQIEDAAKGKAFSENKYIKDEVSDTYRHFTGAVGMAKIPETTEFVENRTTDTFYIIVQDGIDEEHLDAMKEMGDEFFSKEVIKTYSKLGGVPRLDFSYNIFGQVYYGLDILREINEIPLNIATGEPEEAVSIISIEITNYK